MMCKNNQLSHISHLGLLNSVVELALFAYLVGILEGLIPRLYQSLFLKKMSQRIHDFRGQEL